MNNSFLSYANTFSGGLFFGIGIFHLLSEGVEKLSKYSDLPIPYFLASLGYSFILFIQKVIFGYLVPNAENYLKKDEKQQMSLEYNFETHNFEEEDENEKNENIDDKNNENNIKLNLLIHKEDNNQIDVNCSTNTTRTTTADSIELKILQKKKLSGFIMLLALSIHGLFECLALGIQNNSKNTLFLFIALMIHKWAEAFSLGIFFVQAKLAKKNYYLLIIFFAIIGPIGVLLGIILSKTANEFIEGVFLCISTGTFLYVACSEVIVEEFSTPDKRYLKFFLYLMGTIFAGGLTVFEYLI
jgi:zinc transporter 1/2/3